MVLTWQQLELEDCGWDCLRQWGWNWLCSQQLWPLVPALLPGAASCFHLRQLRKGDSRRHTFFISPDQLPVNWSPHIRMETNNPINILFTLDWHICMKGPDITFPGVMFLSHQQAHKVHQQAVVLKKRLATLNIERMLSENGQKRKLLVKINFRIFTASVKVYSNNYRCNNIRQEFDH